ncbi:MAG: SDR family oxidoreductase [Nitrospirae bacterium]|nr:MAG: SDR family oxidoreductase [Nitrospirota bacterium]
MTVQDRIALVTGGGTGIGRGIALALAAQGAKVAICGRHKEKLDDAAHAIYAGGGEVLAVPADVTRRPEVEVVVDTVVRRWGQIDILVNNAGASGRTPIDDPDDQRWLGILDVNLTGSYLCAKLVFPHMKGTGYGRIINMSSVLGRFGVPGYLAYCTAKHGILGFTKALALEVAELGITVNAVCPTWVDTAMARQGIEETAARLGIPPEMFREQAIAAIPIKRMASVEEVASLVVYLCSPEAAAITGQAINVCGGATAGMAG